MTLMSLNENTLKTNLFMFFLSKKILEKLAFRKIPWTGLLIYGQNKTFQRFCIKLLRNKSKKSGRYLNKRVDKIFISLDNV